MSKKLKEVEEEPTFVEEQRQLYRDRLDDLNNEKQARLEILTKQKRSSDARSKDKANHQKSP